MARKTPAAHVYQIDALSITTLFIAALQRAGFAAVIHSEREARSKVFDTTQTLILTGQLWRFSFEAEAGVPSLTLDASLMLRDLNTSSLLWAADFPCEEETPLWIGVGCPTSEPTITALEAVTLSAAHCFSTTEFQQAAGRSTANEINSLKESQTTHEIVPSSSWTGAESGDIRSTAHETWPQVFNEPIPTADTYQQLAETVGKSVH